jgi:uncharacterized delta-60 repeat protein
MLAKSFGLRSVSLVLLSVLFLNLAVFGAAGDVDLTFNASITRTPGVNSLFGISIQTATLQPDGKILIGGNFEVVNGQTRSKIARLNQDGSLDTSFYPADLRRLFEPDFNLEIIETIVYSIGLQSDGKIIIAGSFSYHNGVPKAGIARLNPNGTLDNTFNSPNYGSIIYDIKVQPDNKILVAKDTHVQLLRLNADGTVDNTFQPNISFDNPNSIALQADGKVLVSSFNSSNITNQFVRLNTNGTLDNTFLPGPINNGRIETITIQTDGKILIGGTFSGINGFAANKMARLETDGSLDVGFATTGAGANNTVFEIQIGAGGKIFVGGSFSTFNGATRQRIAKLNADGTVDNSFNLNATPIGSVLEILELPGGKVFVGGNFTTSFLPPLSPSQPLFLNADGTIDNSVFNYIGNAGAVSEIAVQTDGKVLAGGRFTVANGTQRNNLARFNVDGTLDTSFVPFATATTAAFFISAIAPQPDGKVLVGMNAGTGTLVRLNSDGSADSTFNAGLQNNGYISDMALLPDGKIIGVGAFRRTSETFDRKIARFNANGSFDTTFEPPVSDGIVYKVLVQPDGKILIGGSFQVVGGSNHFRIARLNANGSVDATFNSPGGVNNTVYDMALQTDGKIVLVGLFTAVNGSNSQRYVGRLNADGTLDTSFSQTASYGLNAVEIDTNGKILIGGPMGLVGGVSRYGLARLNSDGTVDNSFQVGAGTNYPVFTIKLQSDGKIIIGGEFSRYKNVAKVGIARLSNSAPLKTLFDYDGDGRADVSVFRPSENRWYIFRSSNSTVYERFFGNTNDVLSPADYDGDGKTDLGIFRPVGSGASWWYLSTVTGQETVGAIWGSTGDVPRPSDFDGDGKADYILTRILGDSLQWYRRGSTGALSIQTFGYSTDKPVIGDFDGDGKSDLAIYRPSTGDWWWQSSIDNIQRATRWGISTDVPAPADFDGDGRTDFAVYRPSTGVWYVINSSNGSFTIMNFGLAEDKPVAADYDGDGKADIAVFRPSTGIWYLMRSTAGFTALQFGVSTDIPTQNAFLP